MAVAEEAVVEAQLEEALGDGVVVVAEEVAFVGEVAGDGFYAEGADAFEVGLDGALAFGGVFLEQRGGDGGGVDEGVVEDGAVAGGRSAVLEDALDVLGGGEAEGLVGLGHEIADVDADGARGGECFGDAADEEVGDERGVEGAGAEGDEVGLGDGFEGAGEGFGVGRMEHELGDAAVGPGDVGFAVDDGAVVHAGGEGDVGVGGGVDAAAGGEDLRRHLDGLGKIAGHAGEGGEKEIAEGVAFELA